jgi:hypothetical protein
LMCRARFAFCYHFIILFSAVSDDQLDGFRKAPVIVSRCVLSCISYWFALTKLSIS